LATGAIPQGPDQYILSTIYSTGCYSNALIDTDNINVPIKSNTLIELIEQLVVFIGEGATSFFMRAQV